MENVSGRNRDVPAPLAGKGTRTGAADGTFFFGGTGCRGSHIRPDTGTVAFLPEKKYPAGFHGEFSFHVSEAAVSWNRSAMGCHASRDKRVSSDLPALNAPAKDLYVFESLLRIFCSPPGRACLFGSGTIKYDLLRPGQ